MSIKEYIWDKVITDKIKSYYLYYVRSSSRKKAYAEDRDELNKNLEFRDIHKGERVFIIGNGPSLQQQDLRYLRNEYVMTVNYANKLQQFDELNTNYHFCLDSGVIKQAENGEVNKTNLDKMFDLQRKGNCTPTIFLNIQAKEYVNKNKINEKFKVRYMYPSLPMDVDYRLPVDLTRYAPGSLTTVVQWAIYAAIYMGFSEIYLLGCDCTNIINVLYERAGNNAENAYGYKQDENDKKVVRQINSHAPIEDYFKGGYRMFEIYRKQYELCKQNNVKLVNCTEGGLLDNIPRMRYEELFDKDVM